MAAMVSKTNLQILGKTCAQLSQWISVNGAHMSVVNQAIHSFSSFPVASNNIGWGIQLMGLAIQVVLQYETYTVGPPEVVGL